MTIRSKTCFAAVSCAAALALAGCGKPDQIDLLGVKVGMTETEVHSVGPAGTTLYCLGDGDIAFDKMPNNGLNPSTTFKFCTWTTVDSNGKRSFARLEVGGATSFWQQLAFNLSDGKLNSFSVEFPGNAYDPIQKNLKDKWGSSEPSSEPQVLGRSETWTAKDNATLSLTSYDDTSRPPMTAVALRAPKPASASSN